MTDPVLIVRLRKLGCPYPIRLITEAGRAGLSVALGCSLVVQESVWDNIFGHDEYGTEKAPYWGAGLVTHEKYLGFAAERDRTGRSNGVGVVQLTDPSLQRAADAHSGCWIIAAQMAIGFEYLAENIRRDGLHAGVAAYNGSGPAAEAYADEVIARAVTFAKELHLPAP